MSEVIVIERKYATLCALHLLRVTSEVQRGTHCLDIVTAKL